MDTLNYGRRARIIAFDSGPFAKAEIVDMLRDLGAEGVWGNHDFGFCRDVSDWVRERYPAAVRDYFATLRPTVEIAGCRFQFQIVSKVFHNPGEGHPD